MIDYIKFSNFFSFYDEVTLNFVSENLKTKTTKNLRQNIFSIDKKKNLKKTLILFGSNGYGKSNIIKTLFYCKNLILENNFLQNNPVPYFRFIGKSKPSVFQIGFDIDGLRYEYSFSIFDDKILEETLSYIPEKNKNRIYQRTNDKYTFASNFSISKLRNLSCFVKDNELFLTVLSQISLEKFLEDDKEKLQTILNVFDFFKYNFAFSPVDKITKENIDLIDEYKDLIIELMNLSDFKIADIIIKEEFENYKLLIQYENIQTEILDLDKDESSGFRKIIYFLISLISSYNNSSLLLVDNFARDLNPVNAKFLIRVINSLDTVQCLLSSNCTSLLDTNLFRIDQIGFISKNEFNQSELTMLTEFKTFRDTMNCEKCYLQGRFDGVPYIMASNKNIRDLLSDYL